MNATDAIIEFAIRLTQAAPVAPNFEVTKMWATTLQESPIANEINALFGCFNVNQAMNTEPTDIGRTENAKIRIGATASV